MLMFSGPQLHLKKRIKEANEEKQINPFILYSKVKKNATESFNVLPEISP